MKMHNERAGKFPEKMDNGIGPLSGIFRWVGNNDGARTAR